MKEFKKVIVKPMTAIEDLKLVSVSQKSYDLRGVSPESQDLVRQIFSQVKGASGVIVATGVEDESGEPKLHIASVSNSAQHKGQVLVWKEPNLVHLYLQIASEHLEKAYNMANQIKVQKMVTDQRFMEDYTKEVIQGIVFTIMAITAFLDILINRLPDIMTDVDGYEYPVDRVSFERANFDRKLEVVPVYFGLDYKKDYPVEYHKITKLNDLRNSLVHLKSESNDNATHYMELFKSLVNFNSKEAIEIVIRCINAIEPDYVETI